MVWDIEIWGQASCWSMYFVKIKISFYLNCMEQQSQKVRFTKRVTICTLLLYAPSVGYSQNIPVQTYQYEYS